MSALPAELWPWLAFAGLGLFHGVNPAMGWLFAVALGLHRGSQRIVLLSLIPIVNYFFYIYIAYSVILGILNKLNALEGRMGVVDT